MKIQLVAMLLSALGVWPVRGQFVPGHIFLPYASTSLCEMDNHGIPYDSEAIIEVNPEDGSWRFFATIPRQFCGNISCMAFSPDGRRLRVAAEFLGVIWEFDPQGNRTVALDSWNDGIAVPAAPNCVAYDDVGNFYVANYYASNVLKFPADGSPAEVLDERDLNDIPHHVTAPIGLAVAPDGSVYVIDEPPTG